MAAGLIASRVGDQEIVNSSAETSVFSSPIAGGTLNTDRLMIVRSIGDVFNDSGADITLTERMKYGGFTFHTFNSGAGLLHDSGATARYADIAEVFLGAANLTNQQRSMMGHRQGGSNSGAGGFSGGNDHQTSVNDLTIDSTLLQTLQMTAQLSVAHPDARYRNRGVWVEHWTQGAPSPGAGTVLLPGLAGFAEVNVVNTTALTTVYTITLPGGTLGTGNLIIFQVYADALNTSGATAQWVYEATYGGQGLIIPNAGVAQPSNASRYGFPAEIWLAGGGATNLQVGAIIGHGIGGSPASGTGVITAGGQWNNSTNQIAVDSTVNQTFQLKVKLSVASPSVSYRLNAVTATVIKP